MQDSSKNLGLAAAFLVLGLLEVFDLVEDLGESVSVVHVVLEALAAALALACMVLATRWGLAELQASRRRYRDALAQVERHRAEAARWQEEARRHLRGLGEAIDHQFEAWGLSPAEAEVGILLLKGLSLREIAEVRGTSERTARQQARAIYRKSGLGGRAELSAWFLEDLLLPGGRGSTGGS